MSNSKPSKSPTDIEILKADVASFASSLGLSSSLPSSGFNDSDFRKTGNLKSQKPNRPQTNSADQKDENEHKQENTHNSKSKSFNRRERYSRSDIKSEDIQKKTTEKPKPKSQIFSVDDENGNFRVKRFEKYKNLPKLPLVKASLLSSEWFKDAADLQEKVLGKNNNQRMVAKNLDERKSVVEKKRELGERLMWQYTLDFDSSKGISGDFKMVIAAQKSGTEADKVTAFEIMVGENPIANIRSLDALLGMVTSKVGKRYAFKGFKALSELFIKLLPDRKLKTLLQQPLNNLPETKDGYSLLLFWYWEECLKQRYERFVVSLEEASRDMLPQLKDKALKTIYSLLTSKSEQERRLLASLVNKLGDPQSKSASNADFHLSNLLSDHPNMKAVVIDEVDTFLFRPHLGLRAKYHAINFLSQIRLSHIGDGPKVAKRLIDVYFALFKVLITEAGSNQVTDKANKLGDKKSFGIPKDKQNSLSESHVELDSRLLSALLTGVNRAFPYVSTDEADDIIEVQTPMLFKLVHSKNFNVGVQALMLLDKISSKNQVVSDRFYRALYSKLLLPSAMNSSKAEMFIGLVLRAMKNDINLKRVAAFSKRVLQVALQQPPQYACGCLFLLSEVLKARPPLWHMVVQNESVDEDIEHFEDVREEADSESTQVEKKEDTDPEPDHGDGGQAAKKERDSSEDEDNSTGSDLDDEDDDAFDEAEELFMRENSEDLQETKKVFDDKEKREVPSKTSFFPGGYDPRHREPSYCNGDRASWWELTVLASHVHPSVATMAGTLISGTNIVYNGNPLNDLSLAAFLDKFMEKKPKPTTWHGGSQIEPTKKLDMMNHLIGPEIVSLAETDVPPEDLVFHKFYMNKMECTKKSKKKKKKKLPEDEAAEELFEVGGDGGDVSDDGDVEGGDESDNEEIENMLDAADGAIEAEDGGYDYEDLHQVDDEDDDDLVGNDSDAEMDILEGEEFDASPGDDVSNDAIDDDDDDINIGDVDDDGDGGNDRMKHGNRKRKKMAGASPFASLEEYQHLIDQDDHDENEEIKGKRKIKPRKKKKKKKKTSSK